MTALAADLLRRRVGRGEYADARPGDGEASPVTAGLVGGVKQFGDPEVEELRARPAGLVLGHEDVRRLEVAVDDEAPVCGAHSRADLGEEAEPVLNGEPPPVAVGRDGLALDELHREVRPPVEAPALGDAAVEEAGDVGVVEAGEDLALLAEPGEHGLGVHPAPDELERGALAVSAVGALGEEDVPHPTSADAADDLPRPDALAHGAAVRLAGPVERRHGGVLQKRPSIGGEHALGLAAELGVRLGGEAGGAVGGGSGLELVEEVAQAAPMVRCHGALEGVGLQT